MKSISLNSRYLKPGDKIIRVKPLEAELGSENSFLNSPVLVVRKTPTHLEVKLNFDYSFHLPLSIWNDGNWVRWKY